MSKTNVMIIVGSYLTENREYSDTLLGITRQLDSAFNGVYLTAFVKEPCAKILKKDIKKHGPVLLEEIMTIRPRVIIAVGKDVAGYLLGDRIKNIADDHGGIYTWGSPDGLFFHPLSCYIVPVMSLTAGHSDLIARRALSRDLQRVQAALNGKELADSATTLVQNYTFSGDVLGKIQAAPYAIIDIETDGIGDDAKITMIGVRADGVNYIMQTPTQGAIQQLAQSLSMVIGHNLYFDLYHLGRVASAYFNLPCFDTMLAAQTDGEARLSLKHLTTMHTELNTSRALGDTRDTAYLAQDLAATQALYDVFRPRVEDKFITSVLNKAVCVLARAKAHGLKISVDYLGEVKTLLQNELDTLRAGIPFNPASTKELTEWLNAAGLTTGEKTPGGKMSTSAGALETLKDNEIIARVLAFRAAAKMMTSFITSYSGLVDGDGFLHPSLNLHGTRTGRLSSSGPNLQQVPRSGPIKNLFISRWEDGYIGAIDLSQAELRLAAQMAGDTTLRDSLLTDDAHRSNAALMFDKRPEDVTAHERTLAKTITFGLMYGGSASGLAHTSGFPEKQVAEAMRLFNSRFPILIAYMDNLKLYGEKNQKINTPLGRVRDLTNDMREEGPAAVGRKAVNTPIQAMASDVNLMIALKLDEILRRDGLNSLFLFMVHDSIILDVAPGEADRVAASVKEAYETFWVGTPLEDLPLWHTLPLTGELKIGKTWAAIESGNDAYSPHYAHEISNLGENK